MTSNPVSETSNVSPISRTFREHSTFLPFRRFILLFWPRLAPEHMDSLGSKFRTVRESQGLTLEQMVSRTRIQESYLKALEEDSFGQLPERVFTKGFVRAYARSLNLDEEECLRLFAECSVSFYQAEDERQQKFALLSEGKRKGRTSRVMVVLLVGGLVGLGGLVLLQQQSSMTSTVSPVSQQAVEPNDTALSEPELPGNASESAEDRPPSSSERQIDADSGAVNMETASTTDVDETPEESPADVRPATPSLSSSDTLSIVSPTAASEDEPLVLEIRTLETTWVVVRSDEKEPQEALLQVGETVKWKARERFLLTLGNAGGVEVRLNGELRGPFGETGVVRRNLELRP